MGIHIVKKITPLSIKILKVLVFVVVVVALSLGYYFYKKEEAAEANKKIVNPLSNLSYEVANIQSLYGKENIKELMLKGETITFKISETSSLEPLISRYQGMIKVIFNENGYNHIIIDKKNIVSEKVIKQMKKNQRIDND